MSANIISQTSPITLPGLTWVAVEGRALFPLTFTTNACTREYEAPRTQRIVLDFLFLQGCLGNEEGLPLEVCETLGNKKHHNSHLFHSITPLNLTLFQPGTAVSVLCVRRGSANQRRLLCLPLSPNTVILKITKNDIFHWKIMSIQIPLHALFPLSLQLPS